MLCKQMEQNLTEGSENDQRRANMSLILRCRRVAKCSKLPNT